jgi:hypothetical protein
MNRKFAASVLSVLLYAQGLLCFAGAAAVLLKDVPATAENPASGPIVSIHLATI